MTVGMRHDDLRRRNRAMVIAAARRGGQVSRTEITTITGLSHSTISAISADLIAEGILAEARQDDAPALRRGRPQIGLELDPAAASVVTLMLSLNTLSAVRLDYSGSVLDEEQLRLDTRALSREALIGECVAVLQRCLAHPAAKAGPPLRIVFAVQGITDAEARSMLWSPITPHTDIPFADMLEAEFSVPVTVENDCNMMAEALRWRDPARYRDDFIAILLSHGIGMGLVLKGEMFTGTHSSGVEFGHMVHRPDGALCRCGRRGCIEAYAGSYAIWRSAAGHDQNEEPRGDIGEAEMRALAEAARDHEGRERKAFRIAGEALGFGLGSLFALIDPAPVALVGLNAAAFDLIEPSLRDAIARTAGGQHSGSISFSIEPDQIALLREGCAMRALTYVDDRIFAGGRSLQDGPAARHSSLPVTLP